jgi:hypothetical protein
VEIINRGSADNDGTGESLRSAFGKINTNFGAAQYLEAPAVGISGTATASVGRMHRLGQTGSPAPYTVTLPAAGSNSGKLIGFACPITNTILVTLDGNGSETIDGSLTRVLRAGETCVLESNGSGWEKRYGTFLPCRAMISRTAAGTIGRNTWTQITYGTTGLDNQTIVSGDTLVIPRAGLYRVRALTSITTASGTGINNTFDFILSGVQKNTTTAFTGRIAQAVYSGSDAVTRGFPQSLAEISEVLAAGDVLTGFVQLNSTSSTFTPQIEGGAISTYLSIEEIQTW